METLMHEESCGHTHLDPLDRKLAIEKILADITSDDIRNVAAEVFYHFTSDAISVSTAGNTTFRSTVIACAPTTDAAGLPFKITRSEVRAAV